MKVIIFEDEHYAAEKLKKELSEIQPDIQILAIHDSCESAISFLNESPEYDLIFSDIHLADGLCFNIFEQTKVTKPIIFTTAYDKYALQAFEANGIDYLLKPINKERLVQAIDKFEQLKSTSTQNDIFSNIKTILSETKKEYKSRFLCKLGNKIKSIPVTATAYFYSQDKMTFLIDKDQNRYPINHTLDEIDQMLNPKDFIRLNRKYITHFDAISEIHPYFKGRLKLRLSPKHEDDIVVSTERSPLLKAWLDR